MSELSSAASGASAGGAASAGAGDVVVRPTRAGELDAFELSNGVVSAVVAPSRGADLLALTDLARDVQVLWRSPLWGRDAAAAPSAEHSSSATFFDGYPGGMQEILPNGGPSVTYEGAELGFHGEACKVRWQAEASVEGGRATLRCTTRLTRVPFELEKTFSLGPGERELRIDARIRNASRRDLRYMWGFHPAFGAPLAGSATRLHCPAARMRTDGRLAQDDPDAGASAWPPADGARLAGPDQRGSEIWYIDQFGDTPDGGWYALEATDDDLLVTMRWDPRVFPWVWVWQERHDDAGWPFWGEHHVVAVEPWTSMPSEGLDVAIENGTAASIGAGEQVATTLAIGVAARGGRTGDVAGVEVGGALRFTEEER